MKEVKNMEQLLNDLTVVYQELRKKQITNDEAKQIANMAGKIIKAASTQLLYNEYMKKKTKISFLES